MRCSTNPMKSTHWSSTASCSPKRRARMRESRAVEQLVLQRVVGEGTVRSQAHFFHQSRAVRADGLHAQGQCLGDVASGFALGELQEDLELALGELLVRRAALLAIELLREEFGDGRGDVAAAQGDGADRVDDLHGLAFLVQV